MKIIIECTDKRNAERRAITVARLLASAGANRTKINGEDPGVSPTHPGDALRGYPAINIETRVAAPKSAADRFWDGITAVKAALKESAEEDAAETGLREVNPENAALHLQMIGRGKRSYAGAGAAYPDDVEATLNKLYGGNAGPNGGAFHRPGDSEPVVVETGRYSGKEPVHKQKPRIRVPCGSNHVGDALACVIDELADGPTYTVIAKDAPAGNTWKAAYYELRLNGASIGKYPTMGEAVAAAQERRPEPQLPPSGPVGMQAEVERQLGVLRELPQENRQMCVIADLLKLLAEYPSEKTVVARRVATAVLSGAL